MILNKTGISAPMWSDIQTHGGMAVVLRSGGGNSLCYYSCQISAYLFMFYIQKNYKSYYLNECTYQAEVLTLSKPLMIKDSKASTDFQSINFSMRSIFGI